MGEFDQQDPIIDNDDAEEIIEHLGIKKSKDVEISLHPMDGHLSSSSIKMIGTFGD